MTSVTETLDRQQTRQDLDRRNGSRARRYRVLEWQREHSSRTAADTCLYALNGGAQLHGTASGSVHVSGCVRCGSPWACSVCSPTIGQTRAGEIDETIAEWVRQGGTVEFLTVTFSHKLGDHLSDLLNMLQEAYSRLFRFRRRPAWYGGQIRAVEITHGVNGWHPHVHAAVFVREGHTSDLDALRYRWEDCVRKLGGTTDVRSESSPGWDVRSITVGSVGDYLTKIEGEWDWTTGIEIARPDIKSKGVTPWALLERAADGDTRAGMLWSIYETATSGRRRVVSSPGLIRDMKSDADAATEVLDEVADPVTVHAYVPGKDWRRMLRTGEAAVLLNDISDMATGRAREWLWPPGWLLSFSPSSALP